MKISAILEKYHIMPLSIARVKYGIKNKSTLKAQCRQGKHNAEKIGLEWFLQPDEALFERIRNREIPDLSYRSKENTTLERITDYRKKGFSFKQIGEIEGFSMQYAAALFRGKANKKRK